MGIVASRILCSTCPHQHTQTSFPANGSTHRIVSPFASGVHTLCSSAVGGKSTRWRIDAAGLLRQHTSIATVAIMAGRCAISVEAQTAKNFFFLISLTRLAQKTRVQQGPKLVASQSNNNQGVRAPGSAGQWANDVSWGPFPLFQGACAARGSCLPRAFLMLKPGLAPVRARVHASQQLCWV